MDKSLKKNDQDFLDAKKIAINTSLSSVPLESLLNYVFAVPKGMSFFDDFPIWGTLGEKNIFRFGVDKWDSGATACAASVCGRVTQLCVGGLTYSIGLIGGVATDPARRGEGLASRLVGEMVSHLEASGARAIFLWGTEASLYLRHEFKPWGKQVRIPLRNISTDSVKKIFTFKSGWSDEIFKLMRRRESGLVLTESSVDLVKAHKHVQWFCVYDDGVPVAYAGIGKGIDLTGIIHEWGGDQEALLALIRELAIVGPDLEILGHPEMFKEFTITNAPFVEPMCLARFSDLKIKAALESGVTWLWGLDSA